MVLKFNGDFRKAIGFQDIEVGGITISVSNLKPSYVKEFTSITFNEKTSLEDKIVQYEEYFNRFFKSESEPGTVNDNDIEMFINLNLMKLVEEFNIMFKIVDRQVLEDKKNEELLKKVGRKSSPSE